MPAFCVSQDLNGDGQPEQVLYNLLLLRAKLRLKRGNDAAFARLPIPVFCTRNRCQRDCQASVRLSPSKPSRDIIVDGQRLDVIGHN